MFPLLFEIPLFGGIRIYTYGVLVAAAFVVGILWTLREARIAGAHPDRVLDLSFYVILAALVGSRILYILEEWERYAAEPLSIFRIWEGGLVFYGGLIGAILVSVWYVQKHRLGFLATADLFMPGVSLGHLIGRLGCFSAGCCYGRETDPSSLWAVVFPPHRYSLAPPGVPLIATQLIEAAVSLAVFFFLLQVRRRKRFTGQVFLIYLIVYGLARAALEPLRAEMVRGSLLGSWLSPSQGISLLLVLLAAVAYFRFRRTA